MKKLNIVLVSLFVLFLACSPRLVERPTADRISPQPSLRSERTVLPNGLTVVAVERHKLPILQATLVIKAGAAHDPEGKAGLANLTASLLDKGTATRTALEIADLIDYTGGDLDASCGRVTTMVSTRVLEEHAHMAMSLVRDMISTPSFLEEELAREKGRILSRVIRAREEPYSVVSNAFQELVYEGSPLGRPLAGSEKTLEDLKREDVVAFFDQNYSPLNSILVIVADYDTDEMLDMAREYFGEWEKKGGGPQPIQSPADIVKKRVRLIDMDINQSYVALGARGLKRSDPDYNAVRVMNYILGGGGFVSRIAKSIRIRQGLAYSAYSYFLAGPDYRGYFRAGLETKIGSTSQALNSLLEEIERIRTEPVTREELEDAKSYYAGSLPRQQESYRQIAGLFVDQEIYALESEYWIDDLEKIRSLTLADIQRVAGQYLDPENYVLAIATKVDSLLLDVEGITEGVIERTVP